MAQVISRAGWGAKPPSRRLDRVTQTRGVKVHYTGGHVPPSIVDDHRRCIELVLSIQRMHMAGGREQPYSDIGYNMVACPHRRIFIGRGPGVIPAANGPGLNTSHYAVLALVGSSGFTQPTDELLHAVLDAVAYLRQHGGAGTEIKGHRDGYATDCPGGPLYAWVKAGAPRPAETKKPTPTETEALVKQLPTLEKGDHGWDVKTVHHLLIARDYGGLDGVDDTTFTAAHEAGVKGLQAAAGLTVDGIVGPRTWPVLLRIA
ncbi:N-acetylmuramoyl-L-alanine amidase [Streptosporangium sp. NPDC051022]|uniref:peptidoglycan recognition protein family protein n=1 Tax=Streptosporangium sp. NPDC051022 TaxID=3155752 RepID=UPI00341385C3